MKCIYCNTVLKQGAKFCPNCGKEVIEFNQCVKCGEQIKAGALFCPHCGAKQQIEEDVVSEMIPQEEMTDPHNDEKVVIHEQSITKEIEEPQDGNEAHVIQDENIPISESPKDDLSDTLEPYESGQSSKKWLWILGVILLLGVVGGGWYFFSRGYMGNKAMAPIEETDSIAENDSIFEGEYDIHSVDGIKQRLSEILTEALKLPEEDAINTFFSKEFRDLYAKVEKYDTEHPENEIGFWNGNIWNGGQDGDPNGFTINSVSSSTETEAYADVKFLHDIDDYHSATYQTVSLVFENGNWYIDDVNGDKGGMMEYVSDSESPDLSKGFYVEVHYGYYFYIPRFLTEGEQQGELAKGNSAFYENKGYSLNISVDETDIESQFWMYDKMRSRNGGDAYEESMITKNKDYWKIDDKSGSILLIMQSKDNKMCGTMYFTYPEGGKAIVDEAIEKSIQKTRENDV